MTARSARTARLVIEPLAVDHAAGLFDALDDERVGRFIGGPDVSTIDALVGRIERLRDGAPSDSGETWLNWTVRLGDSNEIVGRIEATVHGDLAEIAYVFGPRWWGHGYATEATGWLVRELTERSDVGSIWATVDANNTPSARVLERLGFHLTDPPNPPLHSYDDGDLVFRSPRPPTVHLLCGRNGAGKTTLARHLAESLPAVRLSRDEWMIRMHGLAHDDPRYAALLPVCTDVMWDVAFGVLATGTDVVLDWNQWSRSRRAEAASRARAGGYDVILHHVEVPLDRAIRQAGSRDDPTSHQLTAEALEHFETIYEPPSSDEGLTIEHHR